METTLHFNTTIQLSLSQLIALAKQLPKQEQRKLALVLAEDDEPTKEQILEQIKSDYIALKNGTLKTRPASEFLAELEKDS